MEQLRLHRVLRGALAACFTLPLGVIGCSHTSSSPKDAGPVVDACAPTLSSVFFGTVDGAAECRAVQHLACGLPSTVHQLDGGCTFRPSDCKTLCPSYGAYDCAATDASCPSGRLQHDGPISVSCDFCPGGIGRRPAGLVLPAPREGASELAAYFERAAFLEAASVRAFDELHVSLLRARAPSELCEAALRAARDEVAHYRATARLSRRFGGSASRGRSAGRHRPVALELEELARENIVEGCVRETFGALVATFQARRAADDVVKSEMEIIAADETRHAALSWAIHHWAAAQMPGSLDAGQLAAAVIDLRREIAEPHEALRSSAGLPTAAEQQMLLAHLEEHLWS